MLLSRLLGTRINVFQRNYVSVYAEILTRAGDQMKRLFSLENLRVRGNVIVLLSVPKLSDIFQHSVLILTGPFAMHMFLKKNCGLFTTRNLMACIAVNTYTMSSKNLSRVWEISVARI